MRRGQPLKRTKRTEREQAAQTLADFERDGLGHHLDNADADLLRAMVRLSAERHQGAVSALEKYGQHHVGCSGAIHRGDKVLGCACGFANALNAIRGRCQPDDVDGGGAAG